MRFLNFISTFFRNITLNRTISLLTLLGLSLGIAMSLLMIIYISYETNYDRHFPDSENIYRIYSYGNIGEDSIKSALSPIPLSEELQHLQGIQNATRLTPATSKIISSSSMKSLESFFFYADSNFFKVFEVPFLLGIPDTVFSCKNYAVITLSAAQRLFGQENPIGNSISIDNDLEYIISGVISDIPSNTHFNIDILGNWSLLEKKILSDSKDDTATIINNWLHLNSYTYYRTDSDISNSDLSDNISEFTDEIIKAQISKTFGNNDNFEDKVSLNFASQPIHDIHLHSHLDYEILQTANPHYIKLFTWIAILVLIVTTINFMHLSTAKSFVRFKEISMRKIYFSRRQDIAIQLITEAILYSFMALLIALVLVELLFPLFTYLFDINISSYSFLDHPDLISLFLIALIVGILSGSYPAIFYSSLKPISILQGNIRIKKNSLFFRGIMVTIQVGLFISLISVTIIINRQYNFLIKSDHGFNTENLLVIERGFATMEEQKVFKDTLLHNIPIQHAGIIQHIPGEEPGMISFKKDDPNEGVMLLAINYADSDFFKTMGVDFLHGRSFNESDTANPSNIIINESAARLIAYDTAGAGRIELIGGRDNTTIHKYEIIGVINDIHFESMKAPVRPMVYMQLDQSSMSGHIIINTGNIPSAEILSKIQELLNDHFQANIIPPYPMEKIREGFYSDEKKFARLGLIFTILTYSLALLSQIGMATFLLHYHQKRNYIKKTYFASTFRLITGTFKFSGLFILTAILISLPLSILTTQIWLSEFHSILRPTIIYYLIPILITISTFCLTVFIIGNRAFKKQHDFFIEYG